MNASKRPQVEAFFLPGGKDNIFAVFFAPINPKGTSIIYVPPFGEEANRCRAIAAQQAREFAKNGYGCLLIDPYGTGDSAGELKNATWDIWQKDITAAANWLEQKTSGNLILWGIRLGALLATSVANQNPALFKQLIFWQPVLDGKIYLTQVLRQRIISLQERNEPAETTAQMMEKLANGQPIEVAGYTLVEALTTDIKNTAFKHFKQFDPINIAWLETIVQEDNTLSIASQRAIEHMTSLGVSVKPELIISPPIWTLQKRTEAPTLIETTMTVI